VNHRSVRANASASPATAKATIHSSSGVAQSKVKMSSRLGDDAMVAQEMLDLGDDLGRYVESAGV
jgi:hypothetical protein